MLRDICRLTGCSATTTAQFCFFSALQPSDRLLEPPFIQAIILQPFVSGRPWPSLTQLHLRCHSCQLICIKEWRPLLWRTAECHAKQQASVSSVRHNLLKDASDQTTIHAYWLEKHEDEPLFSTASTFSSFGPRWPWIRCFQCTHLSQWLHLNGFAPVCFLKCLVSSSLLAKRHSQPSHEHL